jgi:phospholipase/lecithinase/hemolysin
VKKLRYFTASLLLFGLATYSGQAAFSSLYAFGDGTCSTTNNDAEFPYTTNYYGKRFCNGKVWIEVLAERQGLSYDSNKNCSYFGHYSSDLLNNLTNFAAPADASNSLFVIWVANADFVGYVGSIPTNSTLRWTTNIQFSVTNHWKAITNLYAKGARTLVMPNAVDLMKVPAYASSPDGNKVFIRQRILDFNTAFSNMLSQARAALPSVVIHMPNLFTLLDNIVTNASYYGLTNALREGESVDALNDPAIFDFSINGPGRNHIFWDDLDPSARCHAVIADVVHAMVSPSRLSKIASFGSSNRLDLVDVPIGLNGFVDGSTNFSAWISRTNVVSTNATLSVFVPASEPSEFYRLRFPFAWSWP